MHVKMFFFKENYCEKQNEEEEKGVKVNGRF
jgi:hypothetical protein